MDEEIAERLAQLYDEQFGGKPRGRYRISRKLLCRLAQRRRLYAEDIALLGRALYERGLVLIDMETFFAVLSQPTLASYRRVNEDILTLPGATVSGDKPRLTRRSGRRAPTRHMRETS